MKNIFIQYLLSKLDQPEQKVIVKKEGIPVIKYWEHEYSQNQAFLYI